MKQFFHKIANTSLSAFGQMLLMSCAVLVALCGIGLTGLYLIKYVDRNAPEAVMLQCAVGVERPDCPSHLEELARLKAERQALQDDVAQIEGKLSAIERVENEVDMITLFDTHNDPHSDLTVGIGTRYTKLNIHERPTYFCYINLHSGEVNENRTLHFRDASSGDIEISRSTLHKAGVSQDTLDFARSVCQPTLIGG